MELQVTGDNKTMITVADSVIDYEFNESLIHQVVTAQLAGQRQGTKAQKTRSEVSGGGAKPWRQKGTGRARAGTIRSPIWVGGGKAFAAKPRDFKQKVNRKMYRRAIASILSELRRQERLLVVNEMNIAEPKTKLLLEKLAKLNSLKALVVVTAENKNLFLAARNVPGVHVVMSENIDPVNLLKFEKVIMTVDALKALEEKLS